MVDKKSESVTCLQCHLGIDRKADHYVQLSTHNRAKSPDDYSFFHFNCFTLYFDKAVKEKARRSVQAMQSQALQLVNNPTMMGLLSQIQGSDQLMNMLQTPLPPEKMISKEEVEKKIKNDRRNKKRKKKV